MPPPGGLGAAQMRVHMRDVLWDTFYAPIAGLVGFAANRLNAVQFLTIRAYLTLVFGALVVLLMVLAIWH